MAIEEKLLRPLHRQRQRRRTRAIVLSSAGLAAYYEVEVATLEDFLQAQALPYHKDSRGEIWASIPNAAKNSPNPASKASPNPSSVN
jgi:hypothetical protein